MSDTLLWGNARPRIRVGTSTQTNGTNYVFNQPPAEVPDEHFSKQIILNESSLTIYLHEHLIKRRGIFTFDYEYLDRPSCERLRTILNSSSDKYLIRNTRLDVSMNGNLNHLGRQINHIRGC